MQILTDGDSFYEIFFLVCIAMLRVSQSPSPPVLISRQFSAMIFAVGFGVMSHLCVLRATYGKIGQLNYEFIDQFSVLFAAIISSRVSRMVENEMSTCSSLSHNLFFNSLHLSLKVCFHSTTLEHFSSPTRAIPLFRSDFDQLEFM